MGINKLYPKLPLYPPLHPRQILKKQLVDVIEKLTDSDRIYTNESICNTISTYLQNFQANLKEKINE